MNPIIPEIPTKPLPYRGRFAPSPTGFLHIGSLFCAVASWLEARQCGGQWLVRMEDLDPPREVPGAAAAILRTLEAFALTWDGAVVYQSTRGGAYQAALDKLIEKGLAYPCRCSRKTVAREAKRLGIDGPVYGGACARLPENGFLLTRPHAWRLRVAAGAIAFQDALQGRQCQNLVDDVGDFVLKRADGFWAYQLAVVVDDAEAGITHIVRGRDLLDSTVRQIFLQQCLDCPTPDYAHLPLLTNALGQKWSKQTLAPALDVAAKTHLLHQVLGWLGLPVEKLEAHTPVAEQLQWALAHWDLDRVPRGDRATEVIKQG